MNSEYCWCWSVFLDRCEWLGLPTTPLTGLLWKLLTAERNSAVRSREEALVEERTDELELDARAIMSALLVLAWTSTILSVEKFGATNAPISPCGTMKKDGCCWGLSPDHSKTDEEPFRTWFCSWVSASGWCSDSEPCRRLRVIIRQKFITRKIHPFPSLKSK